MLKDTNYIIHVHFPVSCLQLDTISHSSIIEPSRYKSIIKTKYYVIISMNIYGKLRKISAKRKNLLKKEGQLAILGYD